MVMAKLRHAQTVAALQVCCHCVSAPGSHSNTVARTRLTPPRCSVIGSVLAAAGAGDHHAQDGRPHFVRGDAVDLPRGGVAAVGPAAGEDHNLDARPAVRQSLWILPTAAAS